MLLRFQDVSKAYGKHDGVRSVSLDVQQGRIVGLLGPNGAGKTTLMRLAAGLLTPTTGRVELEHRDPRDQRHLFAFLSTTNYHAGWMTPADVDRLMSGLHRDFSSERFRRLRDQLDVPDKAFKALSHGNQAKLMLASTLAREVQLYLLDEPLGGIDFMTRESIIDALIREWRADATIILSTHEIKEAEELFDQVVIMREGDVVLSESADALRHSGVGIVETYRRHMR